jgi:hypothetical protein
MKPETERTIIIIFGMMIAIGVMIGLYYMAYQNNLNNNAMDYCHEHNYSLGYRTNMTDIYRCCDGINESMKVENCTIFIKFD